MRRNIHISDRDTLVSLLGVHDANLKKVQELSGAKIFTRNSYIQVQGRRQSVEKAVDMLSRMLSMINSGASVTADDIDELGQNESARKIGAKEAYKHVFRKGVKVEPKSDVQKLYLDEIESNHLIFCIGPAGTGKTFLAVAKALEYLKNGVIRKIILVRPAVEAGERLGYLPGDIEQKINPYLRPLYDALNYFLEPGILREFIDEDIIETAPLAYMRGRTLSHSFVILDEAQNTTPSQMKMFLTRFGENSKFIITGDITQIDLKPPNVSGLIHAKNILTGIVGISFVFMTKADVIRHAVVQKVIAAYEKKGAGK